MALLGIALSCLIPSACSGQTDTTTKEHWVWGRVPEAGDRQSVFDAVQKAVDRSDFAELDALELQYRDQILPSGTSKLPLYYQQLAYATGQPSTAGQCDYGWNGFAKRWRIASPRSPGPIILQAALLDAGAACYRGDKPARDVPSDAWAPMRANVKEAVRLLESNKVVASADPHYFAVRESLALYNQDSRADFANLLDEGSRRFPYYYDIYYHAFRYYLPQWFGSQEDIAALGQMAIDRTRTQGGTSVYARLYWHSVLCGCTEDLAMADWATMRIAMADLADRFPTDWTYQHLVRLSCVHGDAAEARKYLARMTINDPAIWSGRDWAQCRAIVGPSPHPFPEGASDPEG